MALLHLGHFDAGNKPESTSAFLEPFHALWAKSLRDSHGSKFRDDDRREWHAFSEVQGAGVKELQDFLHGAGFLPTRDADGVFGYYTQAGVRLFQEYVRSVEGRREIGSPDGLVGNDTWAHVNRWKEQPGRRSEWAERSEAFLKREHSQEPPARVEGTVQDNPFEEYDYWIGLLRNAKKYYQETPNEVLELINGYQKKSDTRKLDDWDFSKDKIHLIGIRRNEDVTDINRGNDDLFILLINGMVFKFWGSTDPKPNLAHRLRENNDEAYLVEGQHKFQFGWHHIRKASKVYRAMKPYSNGVLVWRDRNNDDALTEADIREGLEGPNPTINIHWSGRGHSNYSAGCQVIAGSAYINHRGEFVDCSEFAASHGGNLWAFGNMKTDTTVKKVRQTKGAYNVLTDLIMTFHQPSEEDLKSEENPYYILYTLGRDENLLEVDPDSEKSFSLKSVLEKMQKTVAV